MDLIKTAKELGFSDAAIMDTKDLVFNQAQSSFLHSKAIREYKYLFYYSILRPGWQGAKKAARPQRRTAHVIVTHSRTEACSSPHQTCPE